MPWEESSAMDQRMRFVSRYLEGGATMTALCEAFINAAIGLGLERGSELTDGVVHEVAHASRRGRSCGRATSGTRSRATVR
jgi:hypothetical protein